MIKDEIYAQLDRLLSHDINKSEFVESIIAKVRIDMIEGRDSESALEYSAEALYFMDNSDYKHYLKKIFKCLSGYNEVSEDNIRSVFNEFNKDDLKKK